MAPHSSPPSRCPTPCDCSWQGDPIHDEDPMRFHIETGFGEDEFRAFHAMPRTRCVRHICPTRSRSMMSTAFSPADSEEDADSDEQAPHRSTASSPELQHPLPPKHTIRSAATEIFSTPLARERDPPPPRQHPRWLRASTTSLSGLHRSFPSTEDLWSAGRRSRANSAASANHHRTHRDHQQPGFGRGRAQRSHRGLQHRQLMRNGGQEAEAEIGHESSDEPGNNYDELEAAAEIVARAYRHHLEAGNFPNGERPPDIWEYLASINQRARRVTNRDSDPADRENHLTRHLSGGTDVGCRSDASSVTDLADHEPGNVHYSTVMNADDHLQ